MVIAALLGEGDPNFIGLAGTVPMLSPWRLAILGYDDSDIDPREGTYLACLSATPTASKWPPDPVGAAAAARQHVEASADAIAVHFDVDAVDSADLSLCSAISRHRRSSPAGQIAQNCAFHRPQHCAPSAAPNGGYGSQPQLMECDLPRP